MSPATHTPAPSSRRPWAYALFAVLWLPVLWLGAELWESTRERRTAPAIEQVRQAAWSNAGTETAALCDRFGIPQPAPVGADILAREVFAGLTADARAAWASNRKESVFVCDAFGKVTESYPGAMLPGVVSATEKIQGSGSLFTALGQQEADDAHMALTLSGGAGHQFREYPLPTQDGGQDVAQFTFHALGDNAVGVFVRPSMWQKLWVDFRPGVQQDDAYQISINSHGFRDREIVVPKPEGLFRIVCIGGSTTAEGPTNELTYPKLLERVLRERHGADRVEVINAGVFASRSNNELDRVQQYLAMQPDLLLHYNAVNDITQWLPEWMKQRGTVRALAAKSRVLYNNCNLWLLPDDAVIEQGLDEVVMNNLRQLHEAARAAGVAVAFASFTYPDYEHLPQAERDYFDQMINTMHWGRTVSMASYNHVVDLYNQQLEKLCHTLGAPYLPLAENFHHGASVYSDICHMFPQGMQLKAEALAELLGPMVPPPLK